MKKRWQTFLKSKRVRAISLRCGKFSDGVKYALGLGPLYVCVTCHYCEREIETEVR